jgi:myo-inositol-1(or 4)-monophosphatase
LPETDLSLLIRAAEAAGDTALEFTGPTAKRWDKADGAGPVTEADLAVNTLLLDTLKTARPDYGWLSEESEDSKDRLAHDRVFIIDPIDGTRSFVEGSRTWAHSLAIADKGEITAAVVYLPMRGLLFSAAKGKGAVLNGKPIEPSQRSGLQDADILATKANMDPCHWRSDPCFKRAHRPSLAYRLALVAQGRFDAMLTLRPSWEWDIAAGDLIVREAGGQASDKTGQPLRFNNKTPTLNGVVAGGAAMQRAVLEALA